jgi:hypothetical protein
MVSLIILKKLHGFNDEQVCHFWKISYYFQAFSGQNTCIDTVPCEPYLLSIFRKKIGIEGMKIISDISGNIFSNKDFKELEKELLT